MSYLYAATGLFKSAVTTASNAGTSTGTRAHANASISTDSDAHPHADPDLPEHHRRHRHQPLAGHDRLDEGRRRRQALRLHEGIRGDDLRDPTYITNRAQAKAAGIRVGAYHFAQPRTTPGSAVAQADHFLDTAGPVSGELLPVLDLERTNGLTPAALTVWVQAFMQRVYDRTGLRAVIYCSPNFWKVYMANTSWFADNGYQVLWVAHWTTGQSPIMPANNWGAKGWTFWQYTSDGAVPGIVGRVDLNRYNGTNLSKVLIP